MAKTKQDDFFEDGDDALLIDMDEVEEQRFEILPKGTYDCIIEECQFKMSQSSGKPMWSLTMVVTTGDFTGRKLFTFISFSEKAVAMAKTQIMRIAPEVLSKRFDPRKIAEEGTLIGKTCRAKTKIEVYEGEEKTRVQTLLAPSDSADDFAVA